MPAPPRTRQPSCQSARGLAQSKTLAHFPMLSCRRSALAAHKTEEPGGAGGWQAYGMLVAPGWPPRLLLYTVEPVLARNDWDGCRVLGSDGAPDRVGAPEGRGGLERAGRAVPADGDAVGTS